MQKVHIFEVAPKIPKKLEKLLTLAYNLHWCWDPQCIDLFRRLDPDLWDEVGHNPVKLMRLVSQERFLEVQDDYGFVDHMERSMSNLEAYLKERSWFQREFPDRLSSAIAYFSAEFGIQECMAFYSGGLGVLAGDHMKSASDLGIPIVGVGLLYQKGYFQQYLNPDGWQQETYRINEFADMPLKLLRDDDGAPFKVKLDFPGRDVFLQCWQADVGRVPLYLMDTNCSENLPPDQSITDELYGGDLEKRMQQEIVLGIGGYRMLRRLGINPTVFHMNEGHSAFLALEHTRQLMDEHGLSFDQAREAAKTSSVFTTHTPVPAGNDVFPLELMEKYFRQYHQSMNLSYEEFINLGRIHPDNHKEGFCMPCLAIKFSGKTNAVSKLHNIVSRRMWRDLWPGLPENEIPIIHITNGVHPSTWISPEMSNLLTRYLGPQWRENPSDPDVWERIDKISDEELWRTHERGRERLVAFTRRRLKQQLIRRGATAAEIHDAEDALNPEILTIGFARRFAAYKRGTLLFKNLERLQKILNNRSYPLQFIFAGKAHPKDEPGKEIIREIIHFIRKSEIRHRMVFLENFNIGVARQMVQGVDLWLNTPRRGLEASGTSGMKAAFNGGLNMSVLDGWWDEGYKPALGWAIGKGEEYDDFNLQDDIESNAIYDLLEQEITPAFYERSPNGLPRKWIEYIKNSMKSLCREFSTNRMIFDYVNKLYLPAENACSKLSEGNFERVREISKWKEKIKSGWSEVRIIEVTEDSEYSHKVDGHYRIQVKIHLGALKPEDISPEIYFGRINEHREIYDGEAIPLDFVSSDEKGDALFTGNIRLDSSGRFGFSARVLPHRKRLLTGLEPGYIKWE